MERQGGLRAMDDLSKASYLASAGMKAQAKRLRVVSENMANADSLSTTPGGDPYRRKMVTFKNVLDRSLEADKVKVDKTVTDPTAFGREYKPGHPGADADGYVLTPNVNPLVEVMDMQQAERSYEANMHVISISREMLSKTIDLLR
jgi:flagellar basal-body rod protein FlgC